MGGSEDARFVTSAKASAQGALVLEADGTRRRDERGNQPRRQGRGRGPGWEDGGETGLGRGGCGEGIASEPCDDRRLGRTKNGELGFGGQHATTAV